MKMNLLTFVLVFVFLLLTCVAVSTSDAGEKDVLKSLEKIKAYVEVEKYPTSREQYSKYCDLLTEVKVELNLLKREKMANKCIVEAVTECYQICNKGKMKIDEYIYAERMKAESDLKVESLQKALDKNYLGLSGPEILSREELILGRQKLALHCSNTMLSALKELPGYWENAATHLEKAYSCP